ncbi:hypothetical protein [Bacillus mobilis]
MTAAEFNALHPVGTRVTIYPGARDGRAIRTRTRSAAYTHQGHTDVVFVEDHGAFIALSHVDVEVAR